MILRILTLELLLSVGVLTIPAFQSEVDEGEYRSDHLGELLEDGRPVYTNIWVAELYQDDENVASEIAKAFDFKHNGRVANMPGVFEFVHEGTSSRLKKRSLGRTKRLNDHPLVKWVEQQRVLERTKRDYLTHEYLREQELERKVREQRYRRIFNDPGWERQWYLLNWGQNDEHLIGADIGVLNVWRRGYTGKGVVVSILDDGLDHTHPDLKRNYDPKASTDLNDKDDDPFPNDSDPYNAHGTKCGGEVGAQGDNGICGVGVAFNVNLGGVRMLDGTATDKLEATALGFKSDYIDIYSNCWGPKDDGKTFGRPGPLGSRAFEDGAKYGRGGKGSIYVWATGNGGLADDDCNADGYTSSIYTISIGAVSRYGLSTYYDEQCSSTMAVTYTGDTHVGGSSEADLVTTDLKHKCTTRFRGTSSAAPLASGIFALVLEANKNLTWRDLQHLVVKTAVKTSPEDDGWIRNAAGLWINHKFGFGRLSANNLVDAALQWSPVGDQHNCTITGPLDKGNIIPLSGTLELTLNTDACKGTNSYVKKLEHVKVTVSFRLAKAFRGDIEIDIISPGGTKSQLLSVRRNDKDTYGLTDWDFMTVHLWDESPEGTWKLQFHHKKTQFAESPKKPDIEEREKLEIQHDLLKARRDEIMDDYDNYHDEIHHGRFGKDYMRDQVFPLSEDEGELDSLLTEEDEVDKQKKSYAGKVMKWVLTLYGTGDDD